MRDRRLIAIMALVALGSCDAPEPVPDQCIGAITLTVDQTSTVKPRFNWPGNCGVDHLAVLKGASESGEGMWSFHAFSRPVRSGVIYGELPDSAQAGVGPQSLVPNQTYHVLVYTMVGGDLILGSGSTNFTISPPD